MTWGSKRWCARRGLAATVLLWALAAFGLLLLLVAQAGCAGKGGADAAAETWTEADRALFLESFEEVWRTVRDRHYDEQLRGVDWEAAKAELRPRVEQAPSRDAARLAMNQLLAKLGESHFAIIPQDAYRAMASARGDGEDEAANDRERAAAGYHGLQIRLRDGEMVVTRVSPGSPGERAGVRAGDVVERIRNNAMADLIERLGGIDAGPTRTETLLASVVEDGLNGRSGQTRGITVRTAGEASREVTIELVEAGFEAQTMNLPPMTVRYADRDLGDGVHYLTFSAFLGPERVMPWYNGVLERLIDAHGEHGALVIDLRGNIGGLMPMINGMCGWLVDEATVMGEMRIRGTNLRAFANPRAESFRGPVAVLIDEMSISSAEIMSGGLQDAGRARVFGTRTAGLALPSQFIRLPNGDGLQFVFADYVRATGQRLEQDGVTPDVVIQTRPSSGDPDPVLSAALAWIAEQRAR